MHIPVREKQGWKVLAEFELDIAENTAQTRSISIDIRVQISPRSDHLQRVYSFYANNRRLNKQLPFRV